MTTATQTRASLEYIKADLVAGLDAIKPADKRRAAAYKTFDSQVIVEGVSTDVALKAAFKEAFKNLKDADAMYVKALSKATESAQSRPGTDATSDSTETVGATATTDVLVEKEYPTPATNIAGIVGATIGSVVAVIVWLLSASLLGESYSKSLSPAWVALLLVAYIVAFAAFGFFAGWLAGSLVGTRLSRRTDDESSSSIHTTTTTA